MIGLPSRLPTTLRKQLAMLSGDADALFAASDTIWAFIFTGFIFHGFSIFEDLAF